MIILASIFNVLFASIPLAGVTGDALTARAYFDANNVRVGDPMLLTIDFIGEAEFSDLHPPSLSREVDRKKWRVDDASARTETYSDARRLVYRVRPLAEGLLEFPALEFSYEGAGGRGEMKVSTDAVPVHARAGVQAVLAGLDDGDGGSLPMPDGIIVSLPGRELTDDDAFAWRKACNNPSAAAFAAFDFPEAKLNEAACSILEGNWAKALSIYRSLEWRMGQTQTIERGMIAALARKTLDPAQELPAWRQVARPWLRHAWGARLGIAAAAVALAAALMWLSGRLIRALASVAIVFAVASAPFATKAAGSLFDEIDRMMRAQEERMNQIFNSRGASGGSSLMINGVRQEPVKITAKVDVSKPSVSVGDDFEFIVSLESPKMSTISDVQIDVSQKFGLSLRGPVANMPDAASPNPTNVIRRMSIPVRYDVPFTGDIVFTVGGMVGGRRESGSGGGRMMFSFSQNFSVQAPPVRLSVKPLPSAGQPDGFSGAIGSRFVLRRSVDRNSVETNDVVSIRSTLEYTGYVPFGAIRGEIGRDEGGPARASRLSWQRYFVADGSPEIPEEKLCYYDTLSKSYKYVAAKAVPLAYVARSPDAAESSSVAVDAASANGSAAPSRAATLRFAPREDSPVVAVVAVPEGAKPAVLETHRGWSRVDFGGHAAWTKDFEVEAENAGR